MSRGRWSAACSSRPWLCAPWIPQTGAREPKKHTRGARWQHQPLIPPLRKRRKLRQPLRRSEPPVKQSLHYRLVITLYRIFAITVLYLVLVGILAYALVMGFYAVNSSWAAPVILSAADEKSLDFREKLVTSQQTIEDLKVDSQKLESGLAEMKKHRAALLALEPELQTGHRPRANPQPHHRSGTRRRSTSRKQADNQKTQKVLAQLKEVEVQHQQRPGCRVDHEGRRGHATGRAEPGSGRLHRQQNCRGPADRQRSGQNHDGHQLARRARKAGGVAVGGRPAGCRHQRRGETAAGRNSTDRSVTDRPSPRQSRVRIT